jgi:glycosyltransferase involved in cell wall biosynthesis
MTPVVEESSISKKPVPVQVLWIANFKYLKQPENFIELAIRMRSICNDCNCRMIMAGRITPNYQKMLDDALKANPHIEYAGELTQKDVNKLLLESHLLVNTSIYEGFSNTFVQAWMRKVPVVSMHSNPNEVITKRNIGYIAPTLDELTEKVAKLVSNEKLRDEMGNRAYIHAVENHSLEKNIKKLLSILES